MELIGGGAVWVRWVVNGGVRWTLGKEEEDGEEKGTSRNSAMWGRGLATVIKKSRLFHPIHSHAGHVRSVIHCPAKTLTSVANHFTRANICVGVKRLLTHLTKWRVPQLYQDETRFLGLPTLTEASD